MKRLILLFLLIPQLGFLSAQNAKPNIIIIFVDDLGYADIGPFGSRHSTPNLERMARDGRRFTSFYSTSPLTNSG